AFSVNDTQGYTFEQYYEFRVVEPTIPTTTSETTNETSSLESLNIIMILALIFAIPIRKKRH
ncbi:MAG: hypothetical protein ACFFDT_18290, partial [Candidatus Hodarchaeota archaeon]